MAVTYKYGTCAGFAYESYTLYNPVLQVRDELQPEIEELLPYIEKTGCFSNCQIKILNRLVMRLTDKIGQGGGTPSSNVKYTIEYSAEYE